MKAGENVRSIGCLNLNCCDVFKSFCRLQTQRIFFNCIKYFLTCRLFTIFFVYRNCRFNGLIFIQMEAKIIYDDSCRWTSPDHAIQHWSTVCKFGENSKPFQETECFKVWGRGRPRPPISDIRLPKICNQPSTNKTKTSKFNRCETERPKPPVGGSGRGRLLLQEDRDDEKVPNMTIDKKRCKAANMSLEEVRIQHSSQSSNSSKKSWLGNHPLENQFEDAATGMAKSSSQTPKNKTPMKREKLWFEYMIDNNREYYVDAKVYDLQTDFPALQ